MAEFKMPSLGADMEAGTLVQWLVEPGARVKRGDIVAVVDTQKGAIEIEVFEDGVLERRLVEVGAKVPVGTPLAFILTEGEAAAAPSPPPSAPAAAPAPSPAPTPTPVLRQALPGGPDRVRASPAARRLAAEHRLALAGLAGTGPGGVIAFEDVQRALAQAAPSALAATAAVGPDMSQMRAAIGAAMARANREIPHYYLWHSCDLGAAQAWLAGTNAARPPARRLLMGVLFVKATALAARRFAEFNGVYAEGGFQPSRAVHVGVAIAIRGGGLIPPAIHDTADLDLDTLMARMRDLVERVRAGRFRSSEIADPTITVSSLGDRGVEALFGVIYPPQVALVGFGKVLERPWASGGQVVSRPVVTISLAGDHRVSDGHRGGLFLAEIARLLDHPGEL